MVDATFNLLISLADNRVSSSLKDDGWNHEIKEK
jgi:hypothetical protein